MEALKIRLKSDNIGALASGICLVHCIATPFIFVAAANHDHSHHHGHTPLWWSVMDLLFIGISLVAVYWSARFSSKSWIKYALYFSWAGLAFFIFNEKLKLIHLPEALIYIPAISLILLHLYNKKYCQCNDDECCV